MVNWIESSNLKIPETCVVIWHYDRVLPLQQVLVCLPTLRWRLVGKAVSFIFRRNLHVRLDLLETSNVLVLFSLPQMKKLGITTELHPKGDTITCPAFGLHSSPAEYSTIWHVVLDLTSFTYPPKSRERSPHSKRHVTFALTDEKSVYPAHTSELHEDDDDNFLVRPDRRWWTCRRMQ